MKSIETQGKTVDQAIEIGLYKLGVTRDDVKIEILEQAGLFNKARVRLSLGTSSEQENAVKELVDKMINGVDKESIDIEEPLSINDETLDLYESLENYNGYKDIDEDIQTEDSLETLEHSDESTTESFTDSSVVLSILNDSIYATPSP